MAAMARSEWPHEPVALLAADRRLGAREQLRIISGMIGVPMVEPEPRESLADAVVRLGGSRRLFIDMPSDPRLAEVGRASCRERVCQYVEISVGHVSLKKNKNE